MRMYIGFGRPGGMSWDLRKPPTPWALTPAPMKAMYEITAKVIGTATTEEAAMLMPGRMPARFIARTAKNANPTKPAHLRPLVGPRSSRATFERMNSAIASTAIWPRPGTSLGLRETASRMTQTRTPMTTRARVRRLNSKKVPSPKRAEGKKSPMPG